MSNIDEKNVGLRWYVAHTFTGYENKVKESLKKIIENRGLEDQIQGVVIPVEKVIVKKGDEEKEKEVKLAPSYVFVKMYMNDANWHAVRTITGVTGFVGPGSEPTVLEDEEVEEYRLEAFLQEEKGETVSKCAFTEGETVDIVAGFFEGQTGVIQAISDDFNTVKVLVKRGGRDMAVEVDAADIKRATAY